MLAISFSANESEKLLISTLDLKFITHFQIVYKKNELTSKKRINLSFWPIKLLKITNIA